MTVGCLPRSTFAVTTMQYLFEANIQLQAWTLGRATAVLAIAIAVTFLNQCFHSFNSTSESFPLALLAARPQSRRPNKIGKAAYGYWVLCSVWGFPFAKDYRLEWHWFGTFFQLFSDPASLDTFWPPFVDLVVPMCSFSHGFVMPVLRN